ncbi:MAG: PcfJ domain-containing protein [Paludibacteraceae bacterium]
MKPKTKLQKQVLELSRHLAPISKIQSEYGINKCFKPTGYLRKKSIWCLECGNTWQLEENHLSVSLLGTNCPNCGKELKIIKSTKQKFSESYYCSIHTVKDGFQVLRHFLIEKNCRVNYPGEITVNEAVQNWISPDGKLTNIARSTYMSMYYDAWNFASDMEIRGKSNVDQKYNIYSDIYPRKQYSKTLRRNGYSGSNYNISPLTLMVSLLKDSRIETLMKAKQIALMKYALTHDYSNKIEKYWNSIKICIRNKYIVKDATIWLDYIDLLNYFGKDLHNSKYVCTENLMKDHERLSNKKSEILRKQEIEEKKKRLAEETKKFEKLKGRYFGIAFSDDLIKVVVLDNVHQYIAEGENLKHCVYSNDYHLKSDSLILSARIEDKPVETIELSLKDFSVIQSRGLHNSNTEYHERILKLVENNVRLIKNRKYKKAI